MKRLIAVIFIAAICFFAVGENIFATTSNLNYSSYTLVKGQSVNLVLSNTSGTTSWKTSNSSIATLSSQSTTSATVTGKKIGNVTITATNNKKSYTCKISVVTNLATPNTTIENVGTGVKLTWNKIEGATGYKIYRKTSQGSYSLIKTISSNSTLSYIDTTVKNNTSYSYQVKPTQGSYIGNANTKTITYIEQPEMTSIINTANGVELKWNKVTGATSYKIYRKVPGGTYSCISNVNVNTLSYTDKTAISGQTYIYTVRAIKNNCLSAYNKYKTEMFLKQPTIQVKSSETEITISWSKMTEGTGYKVYRKIAGGTYSCIATITNNKTLSFTDTNVKEGIVYYYTVRTVNGNYLSAYNQYKTASITGHTLTEIKATDATCTNNGNIQYYKCENCGKLFKDSKAQTEITLNDTIVKATGHEYESEVTKEATCTEEGIKTYTCSVCGDSYTEVIEKTAHNYKETVIAPTCQERGYTLYECTVCGDSYKDNYTDKVAHKYESQITKEATCTEDGIKTYTCSICGDSYTEVIEATGHEYESQITKEATCTEDGIKTYTCSVCGDSYTEVIEATGHEYESQITKEATCTEDGIKTYTCSTCGDSYTKTIEATGHEYESKVTKEATCTEEGIKTYTCSICGDSYTETIEKTAHDYKETIVDSTCTEKGYTLHTCSVCGDSYKDNYTELKDHELGDWVVEKEATENEEGLKTRTCNVCGKVIESEIIPKIDKNQEYVVAYFKVVDDQVIDTISGNVVSGATVDGDYFTGGTLKLPASYSNWTYEMIVDYNEESTKGIISTIKFTSNSGKYEECSNVFKLNEVSLISNRGSVCIPWVKDSWNSGYTVTIPVQMYAHASTTYEYLPKGDTFWSFSMDSDNGILNSRIDGATAQTTMSTYTDSEENTKYVNKILPSSLVLTTDHKIKEIKIYNTAISTESQKENYEKTGIVAPTASINQVLNGLTDMGSSLCFSKDNKGIVTLLPTEKIAGTYTISDDLHTVNYTISDFVQPDNGIDNSKYESVHITNEPATLEVGKQYPLTAYPYPFNIKNEDGKADEFDVEWSSSDKSIISVIDGLLIAKKEGTVEITATLMGTDISDTVTIQVISKAETNDNIWNVPSDYVSKNGYSFSDTDYESTTHAIYDAIDEASANGYNHIIFPVQNYYAIPLTTADGYAYRYYVPSNMTIEFPKGSVFYMMDSEISRGDPTKIEIHYFDFGVPNNNYTDKCENSHLIMDTFYGERYNTTHSESEYLEENRFVNIGRKAINCSVEITNAYYVSGYFIVVDGTSSTNKTSGVMNYNDFASGWLNDNGELVANENWISTINYIKAPNYGIDGYFLSADGQDSYAGKYWGGCSARQYDILWFNENKELIQIDRFQGRGEYYSIPENASYFKVSLQQSALPTPADGETESSPWIALHDDGSAKMCEIKNTYVYNSATGVFSVVGETDGLWVHDCFTNKNGMKQNDERTGDFENGWTAMRHSVVSNNYFYGYFGNPGGYNTFFHTNYMTNYSGFSGETEMLRYINNTTDFIEISEKSQAHIYYNTIYSVGVDRFNTSIGYVYKANNTSGKWVRSY